MKVKELTNKLTNYICNKYVQQRCNKCPLRAKDEVGSCMDDPIYKGVYNDEEIDLDFESMIKENQELQSKYDSLLRTFELQIEAKEKLLDERIKYIEAIHKAIELLSVDGKGTKQEVKKLLSEVLENE